MCARILLLFLPLTALNCGGAAEVRSYLQVGGAVIEGAELEAAVDGLRGAFASSGRQTLAWALLDQGFGASALLHHRLTAESHAARTQADTYAARLDAGEGFYALLQEIGESDPVMLRSPTPFGLGASAAAAVGGMEAGEWRGPLASLKGWEIILLEKRLEGLRSRSGVIVRRLVFPVGTDADRDQARADWARLPLEGSADMLDTLPAVFRHGRVAS